MTTYVPVVGMPTIGPAGSGNPLPEPGPPQPIPSGVIAVRVLNSNAMDGGGANSNILPQAANNPIPQYGFSVVAILFPTAAGGSYGYPI